MRARGNGGIPGLWQGERQGGEGGGAGVKERGGEEEGCCR